MEYEYLLIDDMKLSDFLRAYREKAKENFSEKVFSAAMLAWAIGVNGDRYAKWEQGKEPSDTDDIEKIKKYFGLSNIRNVPESFLGTVFKGKSPAANPIDKDAFRRSKESKTAGEEIRTNKAFGQSADDGIIAVPIAAQAGGARYYDDPIYFNQLEVYKLPGMNYRGDKYRMFEVDGDSMEFINTDGRPDGLIDGMWILAQKVEPDQKTDDASGEVSNSWHILNYHVYVIVEERRIRVKRLFQYSHDKRGFVVISDNPAWEQEWLNIEDVRELWLFKRKFDWDAPPPRRIDIKVKPPGEK